MFKTNYKGCHKEFLNGWTKYNMANGHKTLLKNKLKTFLWHLSIFFHLGPWMGSKYILVISTFRTWEENHWDFSKPIDSFFKSHFIIFKIKIKEVKVGWCTIPPPLPSYIKMKIINIRNFFKKEMMWRDYWIMLWIFLL